MTPLIDLALVQRLRRCYWPNGIFEIYARKAVLAAPPRPDFRSEAWRGRRDFDDVTYDLGRVHYFVQELKRGVPLDPIIVETTVFPTRAAGPPAWGPPHIEDGHHRFAAAVLTRQRTIPMKFGGLLTTRDWLTGARRNAPPEIVG